jgi:hydrogenase-4 component H
MLGLKLLRGKVKEAIICLSAGRVTLPYPYKPLVVPEHFRGMPLVDASRCIGCGGCVSVCPANLIDVVDDGPKATFTWHLDRCTYCGRCAENCPEEAVKMTDQFETATNDLKDLLMEVEVFMGSCNRCGRCYRTQTPLDPPHLRRFHEERVDQLCDWTGEGAPKPKKRMA